MTARCGGPVVDRFAAYDEVARVTARGTTRAAAVLWCGLAADLRVVPAASYGAALAYFTGSKTHNIAVRALGQQVGLKTNEYGVFRGTARVAGATEEPVYAAVDLPFIPPELRENQGEPRPAGCRR